MAIVPKTHTKYDMIAPIADTHNVKSSQEVLRTMHNFVHALLTEEIITNPNNMAPTTISLDPLFSGFEKFGSTPGGGGKAGS